MFGKDRGSFGPPSSNDDTFQFADGLLELALKALTEGNLDEAAHLYIAAYESSSKHANTSFSPGVEGLHKAWDIACQLKDRSLAEHIFEKLEPYLSSEEVAQHAEALQRLALDKLEEFGFSREDLQDMADMVSEDFIGALKEGYGPDAIFAQVFSAEKQDGSAMKLPEKAQATLSSSENSLSAEQKNSASNPSGQQEYSYASLVGFDSAIAEMNKLGIGLSHDEEFTNFLASLSRRHGIQSLPSYEAMLFRSPSREDANHFMQATAKELGVPGVRMYIEETPMGFPVLCIMATSDFKMNPSRGGFSGPGILMLEDIDLWGTPFSNDWDESEGLPYYVQLTRGAREALMFIRSAIENPEVQVLATCSSEDTLDDFLLDLLEPLSVFDIEAPNEQERLALWKDACSMYPSLRSIASENLVRLSANLSRWDIYCAAREAVEAAYRASVEQRIFVPVTTESLLEVIAAYQPLDSSEYQELENAAVENLRQELENVDDLLKGME